MVVVIEKNLVKGILTDGDARRILRNYKKNDKIKKFMSKNPYNIDQNSPASKALAITNLSKLKMNSLVNIEIDILSKYVKKYFNEK